MLHAVTCYCYKYCFIFCNGCYSCTLSWLWLHREWAGKYVGARCADLCSGVVIHKKTAKVNHQMYMCRSLRRQESSSSIVRCRRNAATLWYREPCTPSRTV